jgi:hypothetical protein
MASLSQHSQARVDQAKADLAAQLQALPEEDREAAAKELRGSMTPWIPASDSEKTRIWMTLIVGLLALAGLCVIGGTILAWKDRDAAALFAAVTGIVGLLVGLFAAPAGAGTGDR